MSHVKKNQGTTILELMLAMTFVSTLLIAIAMTTIHISDMYNRGITLKEVDQAGQSIVGDLQRNISQISAFDVNTKFVHQIDSTTNVEYAGRLCTGRQTYIWNLANTKFTVYSGINKYNSSTDAIKLIKVPDSTGKYCIDTNPPNKVYMDVLTTDGAVEMLNVGDRELMLHLFNITSVSTDPITGQQLYSIDLIIGTNENGTITAGYPGCKDPDATTTTRDLTYCSINSFTIIVRSGNKS